MSFFEAMFGDDFPGTFTNGDGRSCKSKKTLLDLPAELMELICQHASNTDLKQLRLTNRQLAEQIELRVERVYISPNRANLDCLDKILSNPRHRLQVQYIVWDESELVSIPTLQEYCQILERDAMTTKTALEDHLRTIMRNADDGSEDYEQIKVENCVQEDGRPNDIGKAILLSANDRRSLDYIATSNVAKMSVEESYELYQKLYQDEKEIIKRGWDEAGLRRALTELPNLKRITITSEVWRPWNPIPVYNTPFYRALPAGFRKPSVVGPQVRFGSYQYRQTIERRVYRVIMSSLVTYPVSQLQEFIVDPGNEEMGLSHSLFSAPNVDYDNTMRMLSITPLKMLRLSFFDISGMGQIGMPLLGDVVRAAPHLEHLDVQFRMRDDARIRYDEHYNPHRSPFQDGLIERSCPDLKHFALRLAPVDSEWLFNLITRSENLESVLLDKISLTMGFSGHEHLDAFFGRLKEYFRAANRRGPSFTWITQEFQAKGKKSRQLWLVLDDHLDAFLYDGGESPFTGRNFGWGGLQDSKTGYKPGFGWIMNGRDPTFRKERE